MAVEDELEVVVLVDALELELKLKPLPLEVPLTLEPLSLYLERCASDWLVGDSRQKSVQDRFNLQ